MKLKDKPAFPRPIGEANTQFGPQYNQSQTGMTLREFYAGLAMVGNCANSNMAGDGIDFITRISIQQADALIAELEKEGGGE